MDRDLEISRSSPSTFNRSFSAVSATLKDIPSPDMSSSLFTFQHFITLLLLQYHISVPTNPSLSHGTFTCNHRICNTGAITSSLSTFQGPQQSFYLKLWFTCTSFHPMSCIRCTQCGLLRIGETRCKRTLCRTPVLRPQQWPRPSCCVPLDPIPLPLWPISLCPPALLQWGQMQV